MISKEFNITGHDANTLPVCYIGQNESGWVIKGDIQSDWYEWVNEFEAEHPEYGKVWGDFEHTVYADSEDGYIHFITHHEPEQWDYWDI